MSRDGRLLAVIEFQRRAYVFDLAQPERAPVQLNHAGAANAASDLDCYLAGSRVNRHNSMVPFSFPQATVSPSGLMATQNTGPPVPFMVPICFPLGNSQTLTIPSRLAVTRHLPRQPNDSDVMASVCPLNVAMAVRV